MGPLELVQMSYGSYSALTTALSPEVSMCRVTVSHISSVDVLAASATQVHWPSMTFAAAAEAARPSSASSCIMGEHSLRVRVSRMG